MVATFDHGWDWSACVESRWLVEKCGVTKLVIFRPASRHEVVAEALKAHGALQVTLFDGDAHDKDVRCYCNMWRRPSRCLALGWCS